MDSSNENGADAPKPSPEKPSSEKPAAAKAAKAAMSHPEKAATAPVDHAAPAAPSTRSAAGEGSAGGSAAASRGGVDPWFEITRATPPAKRATDPFKHQIFVADSVGAARLRCDAAERARLPKEAQLRWDFFHRADPALIDALDADALAELGARRAAFARINFIGVIGVVLCAAMGAIVGVAYAIPVGVGVFVAATAVLGVALFSLLQRAKDPGATLEEVEAFRTKLLANIAKIDAARPSAADMRALHERLIQEMSGELSAGGEPLIVLRGWAAARPRAEEPADLADFAPRWRLSARRGGVFAVNEHLILSVRAGRLSLRRVVIDLVAARALVLEARELRADAAEVWLRARQDAVGPLGPGAPDPDLYWSAGAAAPAAQPEPAPRLARREVAIVSSAGGSAVPAADAALFDALSVADRAEQARLRKALKALDAPAGKASKTAKSTDAGAKTSRFASKEAERLFTAAHRAALEARLAGLEEELADFAAQTSAIADEGALDRLRAALFEV